MGGDTGEVLSDLLRIPVLQTVVVVAEHLVVLRRSAEVSGRLSRVLHCSTSYQEEVDVVVVVHVLCVVHPEGCVNMADVVVVV